MFKRKDVLKGLAFLLLAVTISCSEDELLYSCDPEVDKYVSENLGVFEKMDIRELATFDVNVQNAAYRSFNRQKRFILWNERFEYLLQSDDFNAGEKLHLLSLKETLNVELFDNNNNKAFTVFIDYYSRWEDYASNQLGWEENKIAFVSYSLELTYDEYINTIIEDSIVQRGAECNCNQTHDECSEATYCSETSCSNAGQLDGCGLLKLEECNGICILL